MTGLAADPAHRNHRRAIRFFWTWLILSTCVSLVGNVVHAWILAEPGAQWLAIGVAAVPPTVLLMSVHGLALLAKVSTSGNVHCVVLAAITGLALGAFLLSFVALRDLAVIAGIQSELAPVLPLVIDLAIGVATLALVVVGDKPAVGSPVVARKMDTAATAAAPTAASKRDRRTALAASKPATGCASGKAQTAHSSTGSAADAVRAVAVELVAEKVTTQPVEIVVPILVAHRAGDPLNKIAKRVGVHHSTVSRIIGAAEARRQRALEAA